MLYCWWFFFVIWKKESRKWWNADLFSLNNLCLSKLFGEALVLQLAWTFFFPARNSKWLRSEGMILNCRCSVTFPPCYCVRNKRCSNRSSASLTRADAALQPGRLLSLLLLLSSSFLPSARLVFILLCAASQLDAVCSFYLSADPKFWVSKWSHFLKVAFVFSFW